jgi:protein TonB
MAPSFKGGNEALAEFMSANLDYPELAKRQGVEGTVILAYTITKNGEIKDIKVAQSVNKELDNEAIRLAKKMPKWTPAIKDGTAQDIKYQLPVKFELTN